MKEQARRNILRLHPSDNVITALVALGSGAVLPENVTCRQDIPAGHKVATVDIAPDAPVVKYGQIIGFASRPIARGEWVHTHNVYMKDFGRDYAFGADLKPTKMIPEAQRATFMGFRRTDGRVATRNYIGVLATCNCSTSVVHYIADAFRGDALAAFPHVDGVVGLGHLTGCGGADDGTNLSLLRKAISGYARHPNFAGVVLVGLGCETNQVREQAEVIGLTQGDDFRVLNIQDMGSRATIEAGVAAVRAMLPRAELARREPLPVSHLVLGVECGGSDAYSGITANPALGAAADILVAQGGTAVLSETPEVYGAEHLLTRRAVTREVGEKLVALIKWWERYTAAAGGEINNNPQPGNKAGGLTTILEKSLGAVAKGGTTNMVDVIDFADPIVKKGFIHMDTPGYDPVSVTGLVAGGANVICFTTGRGSVFGCKPTPSIKLATNTTMYRRLEQDMDLNCGVIAEGEAGVEEVGGKIFELVVATASGAKTKSEKMGFGDYEFAPWTRGATI